MWTLVLVRSMVGRTEGFLAILLSQSFFLFLLPEFSNTFLISRLLFRLALRDGHFRLCAFLPLKVLGVRTPELSMLYIKGCITSRRKVVPPAKWLRRPLTNWRVIRSWRVVICRRGSATLPAPSGSIVSGNPVSCGWGSDSFCVHRTTSMETSLENDVWGTGVAIWNCGEWPWVT